MATKRILVTGASGFVGRPLVTALLNAGYAVRAATRRQVSFSDSVETVIIPDLKDSIDWAPILQGVNIVIHLAGPAHSIDFRKRIFRIRSGQLDCHATAGRRGQSRGDRTHCHISSVRAQIGAAATQVLHEQDEPRPTNQYGRSKLAAEQAIRAAGLPFTIFRPVVIYGPNPKGNMQTVVRLARAVLSRSRSGLSRAGGHCLRSKISFLRLSSR